MKKLHLIAEVKYAKNVEEARAKLDAFRESVLPTESYAITIYEDDAREKIIKALRMFVKGYGSNDQALLAKADAEAIEVLRQLKG